MAQHLMAVDNVLTTLIAPSDDSGYYDYALSMVFANASARASTKSQSSSHPGAFVQAWLSQLGKLGWAITEGGHSQVSSSGRRHRESLSDLIAAQSGSAALTNLFETLASHLKAKGQGGQLVNDWWNASVSPQGRLLTTLGTVSMDNDAPQFDLLTLQIDLSDVKTRSAGFLHKATSLNYELPTCLGEPVDPSTVRIASHNLTARLDLNVFSTLKPEIVAKLGDKFADHCATYPSIELT